MDNIKNVSYCETMKDGYIDYALSVIIDRALPDVRDGLKPVHRRILYDMSELGLTPDKKYKKSARIVGDVLGKYHPHGDSSVYEAMVRLAQDFSMRYPLVDGHGNFGSIDGDSPASMRYTEAKMDKLSLEMLKDINKNTVDFAPNFDGDETEPTILPSRFPNLLVNGGSGIAVGYATNMPPHNMKDTIDQIIYQIDNPNCTIKELVNILKAPDFPTGGTIVNPEQMETLYSNGKGRIVIRAKYHIEDEDQIVFTEIPYGVNKSKLLDELTILATGEIKTKKEGKKVLTINVKPEIPEIDEVIDESNERNGIRIIVSVKNKKNIEKVLSLLFAKSKLQSTFGANYVAIKGNKLLRNLSLKAINSYYIEHQKEVLTRRTQYDLTNAERRLEILAGYVIALKDVDYTIKLIKESSNKSEAKQKLIDNLGVNERQAEAILEIKLHRLTNMEIDNIIKEKEDLDRAVKGYKEILNDEYKLLELLKRELNDIKFRFGDERKTEIIYNDTIKEVSKEDLIDNFTATLVRTKQGYFKKTRRYSESQKIKDGDEIVSITQHPNKSRIGFITNKGNTYMLNLYDLAETQPSNLGDYIPNLIQLEKDEEVVSMVVVPLEETKESYLITVYENGKVSKIPVSSWATKTARTKLTSSINIENGAVIWSQQIDEDIDLTLEDVFGKTKDFNTNKCSIQKGKNSSGVYIWNSKKSGFKIKKVLTKDKE